MIGTDTTTNGRAAKVGATAPTTGSEAPTSATVEVTWRGYAVRLTIRGATGKEVLTRLGAGLDWVEAQGGGPAPVKSYGGSRSSSTAAAADPNAPRCPVHGSAMRPGSKGGHYCPRKTADGEYCRERK